MAVIRFVSALDHLKIYIMNTKLHSSPFFTFLFTALIFTVFSCSKEEGGGTSTVTLPTLSTTAISSVTQTTAVSGGVVSSDGNGNVTARGVVWKTSPGATVADNKTTDGTGSGSFTSNITGLNAGTTYYVRAYATNGAGTAYGNEVVFTTAASGVALPTLTTTAVSAITQTSASSGGNISSDGGGAIISRGVAWSTSTNPTIANNINANGTGTGSFSGSLTGLNAGTTYFVRAYATNSAGTAYGNEVSFTTQVAPGVVLPTLTTTAVSSIAQTTAASGGNISSDGGGPVTARGVAWSTSTNPTILNSITSDGTGIGTYSSSLTGLTANTTYFVRAYATNSAGTAYGNQVTFTTSAPAPTTFNVSIFGFAFSPSSVTVHVGDIVRWTNNDGTAHTVTSDNGTSFNSGNMANGAVFTFTASITGTFPYHCAIHPGMTGTVTVIP